MVILALGLAFYFLAQRPLVDAAYGDDAISITVRIAAIHPILSEYSRLLIVKTNNGHQTLHAMFPDTGGYLRTQLYSIGVGRYLLKGYFDAFQIDPDAKITRLERSDLPVGRYIGAFDRSWDGRWSFINARDSVEEPLEPHGG